MHVSFPPMDGDFHDPARSQRDNAGPHVLIVDDFYDDPQMVRTIALQSRYVVYAPPTAWDLAPKIRMPSQWLEPGLWLSTSLTSFHGKPTHLLFDGLRYNPEWLRLKMAGIVQEKIDPDDWEPGGDGWNGAFHLRDAGHRTGSIHHHYHDSAIATRGWSGLVYLTPDAPASSGTSFFRNRETGRCVESRHEHFDADHARYERIGSVENVFNRLVLFRENVLHLAEAGFGEGAGRRLTQTFFFRSHHRDEH